MSLLVGSFVIWNTFNVLVAQRRRETALLRAVGATRRQVLGGIVLEALVVGIVSSALGLLAGVGLAVGIRELLAAVGIEVPTTSAAVEPRTVVAALLVGVVVTVVAAVVPALRRHPRRAGRGAARGHADLAAAWAGSAGSRAGRCSGSALAGLVACIAAVGRAPALTAREHAGRLRRPGDGRSAARPGRGRGSPTGAGAATAGGSRRATCAAPRSGPPPPRWR